MCNFEENVTGVKDAAMPDLNSSTNVDAKMFKSYIFVRKSNDEMDRIYNGRDQVIKD